MKSTFLAAVFGIIFAHTENIDISAPYSYPSRKTEELQKAIYSKFPTENMDFSNNVKNIIYERDGDSKTSASDLVKEVLANSDFLSRRSKIADTDGTSIKTTSVSTANGSSSPASARSGLSLGLISGTGSSGSQDKTSAYNNMGLGEAYYSSRNAGRGNIYSQYSTFDPSRYYGIPQRTDNKNLNSYRTINRESQIYLTPNRSFDSIFNRFPSCGQLDKLISKADTAAILKTIQTISTDTSVSCNQRSTYLLELVGRVKTAIQKKAHLTKQLAIVVSTSVAEINRLQTEIDATKNAVVNLGIDVLKKKQGEVVTILQDTYKKLNAVDGKTPVLQASVRGYEKQIDILNKNSQSERNRVASDKLKLLDVTSQIASLQNRLKQLQEKEGALNLSIQKGLANIKENENNVVDIRKKIQQIENEIKSIRDQSDLISSQVRDLQIKVQRLRTDIQVGEAKRDRYLKQISTLDDKLTSEKKKLVDDDLAKINEMISKLRELVPSVEGVIDKQYYSCYGNGAIRAEQSGNSVVYVVSGDKFGDYLRNLYGTSVRVPSIRADVAFNKVDIFSREWSGKFGYPFLDSAFDNTDFAFSGSFNCLNPGSLVTGSGTISNIGPNFIEAKDEKGNNVKFYLGSCSRLQATKRIPEIGHKFYWSGVPGGQGYNLYGGSCFE